MKLAIATTLMLCLCGCSVGSQKSTQTTLQGEPPRTEQIPLRPSPAPVVAPALAPAQAPDEPRAEVVPVPVEVDSQASNNATQQSLTGIGVQVSKVAERLDASLVRMEAAFSAAVTLHNEVRADIRNEMRANAELQASAVAQLRADVSAIAHAQAGVSNRMEQTTQNAGRDMVDQFTDGMERTLVAMIDVIKAVVIAFVGVFFSGVTGVVVAFLKLLSQQARLRDRDEKRDDHLMEILLKGGAK